MPSKSQAQARMMAACECCGVIREYVDADVKRGRVTKFCKKCALSKYNETRKKRTKEEIKEYQSNWQKLNADSRAVYYSDYRAKIRLEMIAAYGGVCSACGEDDPIVLVLDHILDNGQEERKRNNHSGGYKMYLFLKKNNWPKTEHQLLCHNCNFRKEYIRRKNAVKKRISG